MKKIEEQAKQFAEKLHIHPPLKDVAECSFKIGWDACLKYLGTIPWDEAVKEIVKHIEANCSEKTNSSKLAEV